jgi:hypothetical protein
MGARKGMMNRRGVFFVPVDGEGDEKMLNRD